MVFFECLQISEIDFQGRKGEKRGDLERGGGKCKIGRRIFFFFNEFLPNRVRLTVEKERKEEFWRERVKRKV